MWWMTLWYESSFGLQWSVCILASAVAAYTDIQSRRIPNLLTGPVFLAGCIASFAFASWEGLADSLAACLLLALPYVLLFLFAGGGAGDAKLMGGLGAWLGLINGAISLAAVALAGVVLAFGFAVAKKQLPQVLGNLKSMLGVVPFLADRSVSLAATPALMPAKEKMITMPYGLAIWVGVCLAAGGSYLWHA